MLQSNVTQNWVFIDKSINIESESKSIQNKVWIENSLIKISLKTESELENHSKLNLNQNYLRMESAWNIQAKLNQIRDNSL